MSLLDVILDDGLATADQFNTEFGPGSASFIKCDVSNQEELACRSNTLFLKYI